MTAVQAERPSVQPVAIEDEMRSAYLDYAMSVIVSRAIPDVCDGLKPVHRRILYAMHQSGCDWNRSYRKSARIVGEVMGKYHPHGDSAIYQSMVRMAQDFSMRAPLIDGQGNFGSMDGDAAAAMRYTESRLAKIAHLLLDELDKNTVDFRPNYDGSEEEPVVLPARFPNLLVNGAGGIAVGMATNIPTFNLGEVINGCLLYLDNPAADDDAYLKLIPGPDFPTGGVIMGLKGSALAVRTGRGSIALRAKAEIEEYGNRSRIVFTEIPYQVNKAMLQEKIGELVQDKKIEGISDIRDESNKEGVRVVIEVKRDANADVVLRQLYSYTQLQISFPVNMLALDRGRPKQFNVREVIEAFCRFREETICRRIAYELHKARERAHMLIGLSVAVANIDEVIRLIREAPDPQTAKDQLLARKWAADHISPLIRLVDDRRNVVAEDGTCRLTEEQAKAILEMKLSRLTGLEQDKIGSDLTGLGESIREFLTVLGDRSRVIAMIREELLEVKAEFSEPRRTSFDVNEFESDIEDLIPREDMVVTVTQGGYIKRVPLSAYRAQKRGGKGRSGLAMHEDDAAVRMFVTDTHAPLLFFSTAGKVYKLKVYRIPEGTPQTKGRALINLFPLQPGETIADVASLPSTDAEIQKLCVVFATTQGTVRRNSLTDFTFVPSAGKLAMKLEDGEALAGVRLCTEHDDLFLSTRMGKAVRFAADEVREFKSRASTGVRAVKLAEGDKVADLEILHRTPFATPEKREEYLKIPTEKRSELHALVCAMRTAPTQEIKPESEPADTDALKAQAESLAASVLQECPAAKFAVDELMMWAEQEQFILTVTANGYGKRSSSYEYRSTGRDVGGVVNILTSERNGEAVRSMTVNDGDQIMLITDKGRLIRCPVKHIRIAGRGTQGVTIFSAASDERVVSSDRIAEADEATAAGTDEPGAPTTVEGGE